MLQTRFVRGVVLASTVLALSVVAAASGPGRSIEGMATAPDAGTVSGRVTSSTNGLGLAGTEVQFYDLNSNTDIPTATATTDATGNYSANLPAGTYGILTQDTHGHINKIYNNVPCSAVCDTNAITPVVVTTGPIIGIDFILDPGGRISGTVTSSATGLPIANVRVNFMDPGASLIFMSGLTDANGQYTTDAGTAAGNVYAFTSNTQGYRNEAYNNVACSNCDPTAVGAAIPVTLGPTTNINFALDPGGRITGTMRDENSVPVVNATAHVVNAAGVIVANDDTDASGNYSIEGLTAGTYFVFTFNDQGLVDRLYNGILCPSGFCNATAGTPIPVTVGATSSGIDFVLQHGGTFTGHVTNLVGGAPIQMTGNAGVSFYTSAGTFLMSVYSDALGVYTSPPLPAGTYFAQTTSVPGFGNQLYNNQACGGCPVTGGTPITVTTNGSTGNINFALTASGSITGTVTNATGGAPLSNLLVQLVSSAGTNVTTVNTNASGVYTFSGLAAASFYVRTAQSGAFINQVYNGVTCTGCTVTTSGGSLVAVTPGGTTNNINFVLATGGRISGTVTNAAGGALLSGIPVQIFNAAGVSQGQATTNASGVYTTAGLLAGVYYARTQTGGAFINKLYNDLPCPVSVCIPTTGAQISVSLGVTTGGKDFALVNGGRISGTVTNTLGAPLQGVSVQTLDALGRILGSVATDAFGNYTTFGLPDGSYRLRTVSGLGYVDEMYDDVPCVPFCAATSGLPIGVTAGTIQTGKNFALAAGGSVSGTVRDAGTLATLSGVSVQLFTPSGIFAKGSATNAGGVFTISGLPAGTYFARTVNGLGYLDEIFNNVPFCASTCLVTDGSSITVTVGNTTNGVGFDLVPGVEFVQNGNFSNGTTGWSLFATPDNSYIVNQIINGTFQYYRAAPPPATSNSAVILQNTGGAVAASGSLLAQFDLTNTSDVRKRISVLVHDGDFSDLSVCTFWVPPNSPNRRYGMLTHTTKAWTNATISLYAASQDSNGGYYQIDNVSLQPLAAPVDHTACVDPFAPAVAGGPAGAEMLTNGNFATGDTTGWNTFGQLINQVTSGVFEFYRPSATPDPAGVILQPTSLGVAAGEVVTAQFDLGNSSAVRKRVTVLLHDLSFSDLSACTFWLAPNQPLSTYTMRGYATTAWTNATVSIYAASVGNETWSRLDNASLRKTPAARIVGTECFDPGVSPGAVADSTSASAATTTSASAGTGFTVLPDVAPGGGPVWQVAATETGSIVLPQAPIDLRQETSAHLRFQSRLRAQRSVARLQFSLDGQIWQELAVVPPSDEWLDINVDLSPFVGQILYIRFVFDSVEPPDGSAPDTWQIRSVTIGAGARRIH